MRDLNHLAALAQVGERPKTAGRREEAGTMAAGSGGGESWRRDGEREELLMEGPRTRLPPNVVVSDTGEVGIHSFDFPL